MNIFQERSDALTGSACLKKAIDGQYQDKTNVQAAMARGGVQ